MTCCSNISDSTCSSPIPCRQPYTTPFLKYVVQPYNIPSNCYQTILLAVVKTQHARLCASCTYVDHSLSQCARYVLCIQQYSSDASTLGEPVQSYSQHRSSYCSSNIHACRRVILYDVPQSSADWGCGLHSSKSSVIWFRYSVKHANCPTVSVNMCQDSLAVSLQAIKH